MDDTLRSYGQRRFRLFWIMNAVPVAFLLEDVLVLYGIRNGVPEPALAALASFVQLTMPFMLLGRVFSARWGLAGGWTGAYLIRYSAVSTLILAPLLPTVAARTALILGAGFVFAAFRAVGVINMHPLNGEITVEEDRGAYLHGNFALFNGTYLLAVLAGVLLTARFESTWIFQMMIAIGVVTGFASLLVLKGVPESGEGKRAAREPFFAVLRDVRREVRLGVLIPAWAGGLMSFALVVPFSILLVKNGYGIDDSTALRFTLVTLAGAVAGGLVNRRLTERVTPRSLVLLYVAVLVGIAALWGVSPDRYVPVWTIPLFFAAGFSRAGIIVGLQHHLISSNRAEHRMHVSLLVELTGSAVSGLTATFIGGGLLRYFGDRTSGIDVYHRYFLVVAAILVVAFVFVARMRRKDRSRDGNT